ncbi:hypothetical protein F8S13_02665 [Chloroflexia bacterium SDU3-3]|nr:hypothetical protein F8S13_02665 [Chloroflexia bacterium SDU3-3]
MTTWLLANVGTRDVQVHDTELPDDLRNGKTFWARKLGDYLLKPEIYKASQGQITMPMIEKALRYLDVPRRAEKGEGSDLKIVLFATDQPETVQDHYRNNDTLPFAHLMRELLFDRYTLAKKKDIFIETAQERPSDYDLMHAFYSTSLPKIAKNIHAGDAVFLLVVGGTQQMNTMLLFLGSQQFEAQAHPLYVSEESNRAIELDIARQIMGATLRRNLLSLLETYAYTSARDLVVSAQLAQPEARYLIDVLEYADLRRNFAFHEAIKKLREPIKALPKHRPALEHLQNAIDSNDERVCLRETIYLAEIAKQTGDWASLLARLHRFSEGSLQLAAEAAGVRWHDKGRKKFHKSWWKEHSEQVETKSSFTNEEREIDREVLKVVVQLFATDAGRADTLIAALDVVGRPIGLRHNIVHRFAPVSQKEIEQKAECAIEDLIQAMHTAYHAAFNAHDDMTFAYGQVNALCRELIEAML